jgi:uncharacterized protein
MAISTQEVIEYLGNHPDFFMENPDVATTLTLHHDSGKAISLIEYQVRVLQKKNQALSEELQQLVTIARDNDRISGAIHNMTLDILQVRGEDNITAVITEQLQQAFHVDYCHILNINAIAGEPLQALQRKLDSKRMFLGQLEPLVNQEIFRNNANQVESAACIIIPLTEGDRLLALGSQNPQRYRNGTGTHFLTQISDLIGFALRRDAQRQSV